MTDYILLLTKLKPDGFYNGHYYKIPKMTKITNHQMSCQHLHRLT